MCYTHGSFLNGSNNGIPLLLLTAASHFYHLTYREEIGREIGVIFNIFLLEMKI